MTMAPHGLPIDTSHGVQQEDEESPKGDVLEAPLGELIVARRVLMAAERLRRPHGDLKYFRSGRESCPVVDRIPRKTVAAV